MNGGYRVPFDPRTLLKSLENDEKVAPVWKELWGELHHQGDVGEASYAAVPHIVRIYLRRGVLDWNAYGIVAIIELARTKNGNPDVPEWLKKDYFSAIEALAERAISELPSVRDLEVSREMLSVIALSKGLRNHAELLAKYSEEELGQMESEWKD